MTIADIAAFSGHRFDETHDHIPAQRRWIAVGERCSRRWIRPKSSTASVDSLTARSTPE